MRTKPPKHHTLLITIWQERGAESAEWRFMLQDPHSDRRQGFVSLETMTDALLAQIRTMQSAECDDSHRSP